MSDPSWLWAVFTVIAAAAQTVRNATQRELTGQLGTAGATHVRFLFGLPFALLFLAIVMIALGQVPPGPPALLPRTRGLVPFSPCPRSVVESSSSSCSSCW